MCGRYTISKKAEVLGSFFNAGLSQISVPVHNASPGQHLPVILDIEPTRIVPAQWGIKPPWAKQGSRLLINARAESVSQRPTFKESFTRRRCLVIADGFYEWKATGAIKQPFRITLRNSDPFAFAGIWLISDDKPTYVILTVPANKLVEPIHNRMPVILSSKETKNWLKPGLSLNDTLAFLEPYPEEQMSAYRVSSAVNNSTNQSEDVIKPLV